VNSPNKGKGMAIKTVAEDTGIAVTMDLEGQHNPKDLSKLVAPILKGEAETGNGSRYLNGNAIDTSVHKGLGQVLIDKVTMNICIQKYDRFINVYLMFVSTFIFRLLFIFNGFETTDFGYHMTHQVFSFTSSPEMKYIEPMIFLTDFVGGMWLSIIGHPSVLWARLGGVLLGALNAAIVFSILENYFEKRKVFFVIFIFSLFTLIYPSYIHYYTFPAFLINLELWVFNKVISSKDNHKKRETYSLFLGFITVPIILSRVPLLLIFIIPVFFVFYYYLREEDGSYLKKIAIPTLKGIFLSIIFFGLFYWCLGILDKYFLDVFEKIFDSATGNTSKLHTHTMEYLFKLYILQYTELIIVSAMSFFGMYILLIIKEKTGRKTFYVLTLLMIFSIIGYIISLQKYLYLGHFALFIIECVSGIIGALAILYFTFNKTKNENIDLLLLSSLTFMIIITIGSDNGILYSVHGMWLTLPLVLLCTYKIIPDIKNTRISSMLSLVTLFLIFSMSIISIFSNVIVVTREENSKCLDLNTEFSDPSLKGIYSTSSKVKVVDELISQIKKYSDKNDKILIVSDNPVFYYLTETKPAFGGPYVSVNDLDEVKRKQRELENKKELPKLFIYGKVDITRKGWPNDTPLVDSGKIRYLKTQYVNSLNYSILWENEAFVIYGRPSM
jgi:hypothetical protein